jgi:hypothetical protein
LALVALVVLQEPPLGFRELLLYFCLSQPLAVVAVERKMAMA